MLNASMLKITNYYGNIFHTAIKQQRTFVEYITIQSGIQLK